MEGGQASWPLHLLLGQLRQGGGGMEGGQTSWPLHPLLCQWRQGGGGMEGGQTSWPLHRVPSQQCNFVCRNVLE